LLLDSSQVAVVSVPTLDCRYRGIANALKRGPALDCRHHGKIKLIIGGAGKTNADQSDFGFTAD
jgi:hypothetical protein